jgi:hypothetical protein
VGATSKASQAGFVDELQTLGGFFLARQGSYDSFLYSDPTDNAATNQTFAAGDDVTTAFTLARAWGGFIEPIGACAGSPTIYRTDWQGQVQLYPTPRTNWIKSSQDPSTSDWTKGSGGTGSAPVVTTNYTTAPDGTTTGARVQFNHGAGTTAGDASQLSTSPVVQSGSVNWCHSVWMKTNDGSTRSFHVSIAGAGAIVAVITPTWQRFNVIYNGNGSFSLRIFYRGDLDANATADISAWGAQGEVGSAPTGYISTPSNVAVTVSDYSISGTTVILSSALAATATLQWSGGYYYRVRFKEDVAGFNQFMSKLWELKSLELVSVK